MKVFKILIAESIPSLNKGEVTILEGIIELFKGFGKIDYSMVSQYPDIDGPRYKDRLNIIDLTNHCFLYNPIYYKSRVVKVVASSLFLIKHVLFYFAFLTLHERAFTFFKDELWKAYTSSDIIIVGHDGSFNLGGDRAMPLFYSLLLPIFAKKLGKIVILPGGSILDPETPAWLIEKVYRYSLKHFDLITLRERISYQNFIRLNIQPNKGHLTADLAFLMDSVPPSRIKELLKKERIDNLHGPLIGFVVTREKASLAFNDTNDPNASYSRHIKVIASTIDFLIETRNASVIFIPHCIGIGKELDDRIVHRDIYNLCNNKNQIKVIETEYDAKELKGLLGELDFFIGERLHACINALMMHVPSLILSNQSDQRLDIIRMFGQESSILYIDNLQEEELMKKIVYFFNKKIEIQQDLHFQTKKIRECAERNRLLVSEVLLFL